MRADLAPFAVDALLALAGLGVLVALGFVPRRPSTMVAALGLAYLTGAAVVPILLIALLVGGVPFSLPTFFLVALLCIGAGFLRLRQGKQEPAPAAAATSWWQLPWRSWPAEVWVVGAFVVFFGVFWLVGMWSAFAMPLTEWDAWSIWARKAQILTLEDSLGSGLWTSHSYVWIHQDYPLQYPVWEALHFRAAGAFETQALLRHVWLFLLAFVWAVAYLLRGRVSPFVWAPLLLAAAAAPGVWQQLLTGYADLPVAMYACLGALALGLWLREEDGRYLALGAVMLAAAANVKNEGLLAAAALLVVAGLGAYAVRLRMRDFLLAAGVVVLSILPWRIWLAANGIEGDLPVTKSITDPSYLLDRTDRVWPSIEAIANELADAGRWLYVLPLAALVVAAALAFGVARRVAAFYLASFALLWAGLVWSYWISPNPLEWHLATSVGRVVAMLMLICLAAALHLSGILLRDLARHWRRQAPEREAALGGTVELSGRSN